MDVEKDLELDTLPDVDEIEDTGFIFEVESKSFNTSKNCADIYLQDWEFLNEEVKKDALERMEKSGWIYRDPIIYPLSKL
ncbi:hypothetical protein [Methanobacterium sp.]|uniref:hypothetical protein n=1 Tax=Methanobacterium sp. TaxID=2164 RepID=UPI0031597FA3